jgi:peptidyl-prolyl cis-trans isomerase D
MLDIIRRNSQSWAVKLIFAVIIAVFVFWGANSINTDPEQVLAKVNGEAIPRNDLIRLVNLELQNIRQNTPDMPALNETERENLAARIFRSMIVRVLLRQEAQRLGVAVSDTELSAYVSSLPLFQDAAGKFDEGVYRRTLELMGMTPGIYEEMAAEDVLMEKMQSYIASASRIGAAEARRSFDFELERRKVEYLAFPHSAYTDAVLPGEAELITFYSENSSRWMTPARVSLEYVLFDPSTLADLTPVSEEEARSYHEAKKAAFTLPLSMHTRHILIRLPLALETTENEVREAREKAENVLKELRSGKKFEDLARRYSEDPQTSENGGDLGWSEKGQLDPAYEEAALALKPGEVSAPARTYNGFHLIQLVELKPERTRGFEEAKEEILNLLREDAAFENLAPTMSRVEDELIAGSSLEDIAAAYKLEVRKSGLLEPAALTAELKLPPAALDGIPGMQAGETMPSPIESSGGFMVIRLKEYIPSSVPDMESIKPQISAAFKENAAVGLALEEAEKTLRRIREAGGDVPAELAPKLASGEASRFAGVIQIGRSEDLTGAIYLASNGEWLPQAYTVDGNAVLVRVKEALPADESSWDAVGAAYTEGLNNLRREILFSLFLARLQRQADIDIKSSYLLYPPQALRQPEL